jgi:hypothetical protein
MGHAEASRAALLARLVARLIVRAFRRLIMLNPTSNERLLELAARAERCARFFDGKEPNWWRSERIDVDALNQNDTSRCLFGQLYGYFNWRLVATVFSLPSYEAAVETALAHGLVLGPDDSYSDGDRVTEFLREQVLARRREAATPPATPELDHNGGGRF